MSSGAIVELGRDDLAQLQALLTANRLPADDCANPAIFFCGIFAGADLVASGGLEAAAPYALLRSIAVRPDYRGLGLAARLTRFLLQRAESDGRAAVYLLTENAAGYFSRRGFVTVERAEVPQALRRTRQFTTLCPQSASCMRIVLPVAATAEQ